MASVLKHFTASCYDGNVLLGRKSFFLSLQLQWKEAEHLEPLVVPQVPASERSSNPNRGIQMLVGSPLSRIQATKCHPKRQLGRQVGFCRLTPLISLLMSPLFFKHADYYGDGQRTTKLRTGNSVMVRKTYFLEGGLHHNITFAPEASGNCEVNNISQDLTSY